MRMIYVLPSLLYVLVPAIARAQANEQPQALQERLKNLEDRLNKLEGEPAKTSLSAFNPAIGMALNTVHRHNSEDKADFQFRTAEINLEAPIDPFLKGWSVINANTQEVEVEETALQTTSLPGNLTLRGGRLFASFGRLAHFHDDSLPVIDRPNSLESFIGGETQADGLELSWLLPTPFYLNAVLGTYNKIGGENARASNGTARPMDHFTYLGRLSTYADLTDDHSVELGATTAWTPKRTMEEDVTVTGSANPAIITKKNTWRTLGGADITYRYQPSQGGIYRGIVWSTEVMANNERRFDSAARLPTDRVRAFGGFSYLQVKLGRHWRVGGMVDLTEDLDQARQITRTFSGILTCDVTEFQKLRLVGSRQANNIPGRRGNTTLALQWIGFLGHHVHGFLDR